MAESNWPSALPKLCVSLRYKNPDTGKRRQREVVSPDAFIDFIKLGAALWSVCDECVNELDPDDGYTELSESDVTQAYAAAH